MEHVNVTELRNHLLRYLNKVQSGEEILLTSRGHIIARIVPVADERMKARKKLDVLKGKCRIGDIMSPLNEVWEATK